MEENLFEVFPFSWPDKVSGRKTLKEVGRVTARKENAPQLNVCRTTKIKRPRAAERLQQRAAKNMSLELGYPFLEKTEASQCDKVKKERIGKNVQHFLWASWERTTMAW